MRPTYNRVKRVRARSEGPNPSGPVQTKPWYHLAMKVEKQKFDDLLSKVLSTKPKPRSKIKARGKRAAKTPIFQNPSVSDK